MKKHKICWITANYMLQVDLPLLSELKKQFKIDWYFWGAETTPSAQLAKKYASDNNIGLSFIQPKYWELNPLAYFEQVKIIKKLARLNYSVYYFDVSTFPWLLFIIKRFIPKSRVVIAMHHGKPHSGMRFKALYFPFLKYLNRQDFFLQYYSNNQADAFAGRNENRKYVIPLALNDFGSPNATPDPSKVVFTSFGVIIPTKNIPLLIEAGNRLWEKYPNKFIINIVGYCRNWESTYAKLIKYKEAFHLDIRKIEESEIPDLFASSHYLVLPYKAVTQSGPLRIAYGYNVPVITSDLEGFRESVVEGETGLLFESESLDSLCTLMAQAIEAHPSQYEDLRIKQKRYVKDHLSIRSVCDKYVEMFNSIISKDENKK